MKTGTLISYKELRKINPEAARMAVLEYLKSNKGNIFRTAKTFGINRPVVYDILRKEKEGNLADRSKAPKGCPSKTLPAVEDKVIELKNRTRLGGKSWFKIKELRKLISGFSCRLIQNHKGHPEENSQLERSHRTDDDEFYIPRILKIKSEENLLKEAFNYIYYYDNVREHSSLNDQTPFAYMKDQQPEIDDNIRYPIPILLDRVSVQLGPWSGYCVLAQNRRNPAIC